MSLILTRKKKDERKRFKWKDFYLYMKKRLELEEALAVVSLSIIFLYFIYLASRISIPFTNDIVIMTLLAILIWIIFILYLWKILGNERRKRG